MDRFGLKEKGWNLLILLGSAILAAYWLYFYIDAIRKWEDSISWRNAAETIESLPVTDKEGGDNAR